MKNPILIAVMVLVFCLSSVAFSLDNPSKVKLQPSVLQLSNPSQVKLNGWLGYRIDATCKNRLKYSYTENDLLEAYRNKPGRQIYISESFYDFPLMLSYIGDASGKWIDGATYACQYYPDDSELKTKLDKIATGLMDCQEKDGYLGTYLKEDRWTGENLGPGKIDNLRKWDVWIHKYNMDGLLSYYQYTGDKRALDTCIRISGLLTKVFLQDKVDIEKTSKCAALCSTLVADPLCVLYEYTGDANHLKLAKFILSEADRCSKILTNMEKYKTVQQVGIRKDYEMVANYLAFIEYWRATGDTRGLEAAKLAWESMKKDYLFITGAPNAAGYFREPGTFNTLGRCSETCDVCYWLRFSYELLEITGDAKYADQVHRTIYNHLLAPLHPNGIYISKFARMEGEKQYVDEITCCSNSVLQFMPRLPAVAYMTGKDRLAINLYEDSTFKGKINGVNVTITQKTDYPWSGDIHFVIETEKPVDFDLQILIPFFYTKGSIKQHPDIQLKASQYATIHKTWEGKTEIDLNLELPLTVHNLYGRYALLYGPQVLSFEQKLNKDTDWSRVLPDVEKIDQFTVEPLNLRYKDYPLRSPLCHIIKVTGKTSPFYAPIMLIYVPFSEAGAEGGNQTVYLPAIGELNKAY